MKTFQFEYHTIYIVKMERWILYAKTFINYLTDTNEDLDLR